MRKTVKVLSVLMALGSSSLYAQQMNGQIEGSLPGAAGGRIASPVKLKVGAKFISNPDEQATTDGEVPLYTDVIMTEAAMSTSLELGEVLGGLLKLSPSASIQYFDAMANVEASKKKQVKKDDNIKSLNLGAKLSNEFELTDATKLTAFTRYAFIKNYQYLDYDGRDGLHTQARRDKDRQEFEIGASTNTTAGAFSLANELKVTQFQQLGYRNEKNLIQDDRTALTVSTEPAVKINDQITVSAPIAYDIRKYHSRPALTKAMKLSKDDLLQMNVLSSGIKTKFVQDTFSMELTYNFHDENDVAAMDMYDSEGRELGTTLSISEESWSMSVGYNYQKWFYNKFPGTGRDNSIEYYTAYSANFTYKKPFDLPLEATLSHERAFNRFDYLDSDNITTAMNLSFNL